MAPGQGGTQLRHQALTSTRWVVMGGVCAGSRHHLRHQGGRLLSPGRTTGPQGREPDAGGA